MPRARILFLCLALALAAISAPPQAAHAQEEPTPVIIVDLSSGYLLGVAHFDAWLESSMAADLVQPKINYELYSLNGWAGTAVGLAAEEYSEICPETYAVPMIVRQVTDGPLMAIGGAMHDVMPRWPEQLNTSSEMYRGFVADFLRQNGIPNPQVTITQLLRVDLEGDGTDEVLIAATHLQDDYGLEVHAGDYSIVLLRQLVNGRVETTMLEGEIFPVADQYFVPTKRSIQGVLDFDRDGVMEIVLGFSYYEGHSSGIFAKYVDGWEYVIGAGCGL
ncbi:MAG: hypothetical protein D6E12_11845 [Desulfovibrio sp.]|nr:MAG: hypothetical protein D6E12_11845 [Desulfovibrio sp.]